MQKGYVLIAVTILTALLLTLGTFFISTATTDIKIAQSHGANLRAYYLAEAAIADWETRLRNDLGLFDTFMSGTLTQSNSTRERNSVFESNDSYIVYAQSTAPAVADIFATSSVPITSVQVIRNLRISVYRATGSPRTWPYILASGGAGRSENGKLEFRQTSTINGGVAHANRTLEVHRGAVLTVQNADLSSSGQIIINPQATVNQTGGRRIEGAPQVAMPQIDFNSSASTSWKSRANYIFGEEEFNALPSGTSLSGILFVDGNIYDFTKSLDIRGYLVVNGDFEIETPAVFTVRNHPLGSGVLAKGDVEIESDATIHGLVYGGDWAEIDADWEHEERPPTNVTVTGGLVGFRARIQAAPGSTVAINYNRNAVSTPLDPDFNINAPFINVSHWEEEY